MTDEPRRRRTLDDDPTSLIDRGFGRRNFVRASLAAAILPATFLAACGSGNSGSGTTAKGAAAGAVAGGSIVIATTRAALGLDPASANGAPSLNTWLNLYDTLVDASTPPELDAAKKAATNGVEIRPMLASAWEPSKNQRTWRFTLQPDAKSSLGNPLTAADVVYSMDRSISLQSTAGFFLGLTGVTKASQFKAIDDGTVELRLPAAPPEFFLPVIGAPWVVIFDSVEALKHKTAKDPWSSKWLDRHAAGFGPYGVETLAADGTNVVLKKQAGYWGKASLDTITMRTVPESSGRAQLLLSGQAQLTDDLPPVQLDQIEKNAKTEIVSIATPGFCMLGMKNSEKPFDDADFRRGLAMAIPYDQVIASAYKGRAERWKSLLPPYYQGATDEFWTYDVDAAAAKTALSKFAGTKIELSYASASDAQKNVAIVVQSAFNDAGLSCSLSAMDQASYDTKRLAGELPFYIDEVNTPAVLSSYFAFRQLYARPTIQPLLAYENADFDGLVEQLGAEEDPAKQNELIKQAQEILVGDVPAIPVAWTGYRVPSDKTVTGYRGHSLNILWPKELARTSAA